MPSYNTDFYAYIPAYMKSKLTMKTNLYGNEPWFKEAWEEFRKIALTSPMKDIPDPDRFFEKAELDSMPSVEPSNEKSPRYDSWQEYDISLPGEEEYIVRATGELWRIDFDDNGNIIKETRLYPGET